MKFSRLRLSFRFILPSILYIWTASQIDWHQRCLSSEDLDHPKKSLKSDEHIVVYVNVQANLKLLWLLKIGFSEYKVMKIVSHFLRQYVEVSKLMLAFIIR